MTGRLDGDGDGDGVVSPVVARTYLASRRALRRLFVVLQASFDGLWLGSLSRRTLHLVDDQYYKGERQYTDEGYNRGGLWQWEKAVVDEFFTGQRKVVVYGAGGGRELLALARLGHDVDGFECNPRLVEFGNRFLAAEGRPERIALAPRDAWPATSGTYDGVIVGWGSYMLIQGRPQRVAFLRHAHSHMRPGSPILLSFFARSGDNVHFRIVTTLANLVRRGRRRAPVEMGDALLPNYVHCFTREEVEAELREGGFDMVHFEIGEYGLAVGRAADP